MVCFLHQGQFVRISLGNFIVSRSRIAPLLLVLLRLVRVHLIYNPSAPRMSKAGAQFRPTPELETESMSIRLFTNFLRGMIGCFSQRQQPAPSGVQSLPQ